VTVTPSVENGRVGKRIYTRTPLAERFHTKYEVDPETGCWNWTANIAPQGYGRIGADAPDYTTLYAHRVSYELHKGPIPEGLVVDHMCNNRQCVNPDHLQAITHKANIERSPAPHIQRWIAQRCVRGHDMADPANVYVRKDTGRRQCKACIRIRSEASARAAGVPERTPPRCGTYSGAVAHSRRKEPSCAECRAAATEYHRQRRARLREAS
jgi:hypothetical protein